MALLETVEGLIRENDLKDQKTCLEDLRKVIENNENTVCVDTIGISVDELSQSLLPNDTPIKCIPIKTTGDGNCLFNAASICVKGT